MEVCLSMSGLAESKLANITKDRYLAQRLNPTPGEPLYLVLSDLYLALKPHSSTLPLRILDLGCGGSPYRSLFPNADYDRADIAGVEDLDFEIPTDRPQWQLPIGSGTYDLVLSSQVLEHVLDPTSYLTEAFRLLKPGGKLLLSTHGTFEDHGCPYDFRRWTSDGLSADLKSVGFRVEQMNKLTTGPRAAMFILQQHRRSCSKLCSLGWWMAWHKWMLKHRRASFDRQCDACYPEHRFVSSSLAEHRIYIGLLAIATK